MRIRNKWLLIPPAAALLLFLGPLRPDAPKHTTGTEPAPAADAAKGGMVASLPRTPDLWQVGSTLIGVLLLGGAGVFVFARMQKGPRSGGEQVFTVRQTHRLSARQQIIAVEFDEQVLLLGAHDGALSVLSQGRLHDPARDDAQVRARAQVEDEADEGAVPKNLVLPRPERQPAPTPPRKESPRAQALGSFRSLLQKAGRA